MKHEGAHEDLELALSVVSCLDEVLEQSTEHAVEEDKRVELEGSVSLVSQLLEPRHHLSLLVANDLPLDDLEHAVFEIFVILHHAPMFDLGLVQVGALLLQVLRYLIILQVPRYLNVLQHVVD